MSKVKEVRITVEEGNFLLQVAMGFDLPEKLKDDEKFSHLDRVQAREEVRLLYKELKAHSPHMTAEKKLFLFGPKECWEPFETKDKSGAPVTLHRIKSPKETEVLRLTDESISGAIWILRLSLDPASPIQQSVALCDELVWPLAEKLRKVGMLREMLGLQTAKKFKLVDDPEPEKKKALELVEEKDPL
jgi:hypothetical protein